MRAFWNSCAENFGKLSENHMQWSSLLKQLHGYSLQLTTGLHYRYILEVLRKERMFQNFENSKKNLNCLSFSNAAALQPRISDFSKHRLQEKSFLLSVLKYFENCQKKVYNEEIWLTKHLIKIASYIFQGMLQKLLLWKFLKIIRKTLFVKFLLKNSSRPICPPIQARN